MMQLDELLTRSAATHSHLCPRQVLGVRMGMLAGELLNLELPQTRKRLLTIVETDGCFVDGVATATNCWVGRRTLRVEDYGKVAATFIDTQIVDTQIERAVRIAPNLDARHGAAAYAPEAKNRWEAMLLGYQRMPAADLLSWEWVRLSVPVTTLISRAGHRMACEACGEEIINEREELVNERILCRGCAGPAYYSVAETSA